jgi:hypothetical protein
MKKPSRTGMVAHELGISTWFGGTLFGQLSLNPIVSIISDQRERGRILSEAWARFQAANLPAMLSTLLGWRPASVRNDSQLWAPGLTHERFAVGRCCLRHNRHFRPARDIRAQATGLTLNLYRLTAMLGIKDDADDAETIWVV